MSIQLKILEQQPAQADAQLKYSETFKRKYFGAVVVAKPEDIKGNRLLDDVKNIILQRLIFYLILSLI
jgi:hypothetical protein